MAHDVFISHSSRDKPIADAVCAALERRDVRCWIAPRDVIAGQPYGGEIMGAINNSRVMVLILSADANKSEMVMREVERAVSRAIPIIPFRIEDVRLSNSLEFFLGSIQWLDALTPPLERHLQSLADLVDQSRSESGVRPARPPLEQTTFRHGRRKVVIATALVLCGLLATLSIGWAIGIRPLAEAGGHDKIPVQAPPADRFTGEASARPTQTADSKGTSKPEISKPVNMPAAALGAVLDVMVCPEGASARPGRRLNEVGVLPLKPGDLLRIEARVDRPAYLYLVWLDAVGDATPMWPWRRGDWKNRPAHRDTPRSELHIPDEMGAACPCRPMWPACRYSCYSHAKPRCRRTPACQSGSAAGRSNRSWIPLPGKRRNGSKRGTADR